MTQNQNIKLYDLEERTLRFAREINSYVNNLPRTISNIENGKQLVRSGGSVGANYREANDSLSKKDFLMRIKICRKEAKESVYWADLTTPNEAWQQKRLWIMDEGTQLMKIFGSIIEKSEKPKV